MVARNGLSVDEGLHVEAVPYSRLRLVHYFYSTQRTQSNKCQPRLTLSQEKKVGIRRSGFGS
ncbi:hypothetical protein PGR6_44890 [Pseudomonas sp. GR 6-02]|nr:hypothetical protein PGR6_44890 [Pseudomonas sp. GR 6-02]